MQIYCAFKGTHIAGKVRGAFLGKNGGRVTTIKQASV